MDILKILEKYNARATFFCIGKNIENHPEILKEIYRNNHIIGNHSYSHDHLINFYRGEKIINEIEKTESIIKRLIHKKTLLFRPPHGVTNPPISKAVKKLGYKVMGWSIRSFDTIRKVDEKLIRNITSKISPGSVILLHDHVEKSDLLLEEILKFLSNSGYKCVGVDELFNIKVYD